MGFFNVFFVFVCLFSLQKTGFSDKMVTITGKTCFSLACSPTCHTVLAALLLKIVS